MIKNVYVVDSENTCYWLETKEQTERWIEHIKEEGQEDIRFTFSEVEIDNDDNDLFEVLNDIKVFIP